MPLYSGIQKWLHWSVLSWSSHALFYWEGIFTFCWDSKNNNPKNEGKTGMQDTKATSALVKEVTSIISHCSVFSKFPGLIFSGAKKCRNMVQGLAKHTESVQLAVLVNPSHFRRHRFVHSHLGISHLQAVAWFLFHTCDLRFIAISCPSWTRYLNWVFNIWTSSSYPGLKII